MTDFYQILKNLGIKNTLKKYCGDTTLKYNVVAPQTYFLNKNIDFSTLTNNNEMPFILYLKGKKIIGMDIGSAGSRDYCSLFQDGFLYKCIVKAAINNWKIILGHTHPTFKDLIYGAIFSNVKYCDAFECSTEEIIAFILDDSQLYDYHIQTGLYKKFGGDYCDYFTLIKVFRQISNIGCVYNATMNSLGLYWLKDDGVIDCLKWETY